MRRRATIWGTATLAAIGVVGPAGAVSEPPRQTYAERFTTDVPGASTGRSYLIDWVNPADPQGKPRSFSHLRVELAEGTSFDTSALPYCQASDAELTAAGASACPRESRVADDESVIDTGVPGHFINDGIDFICNSVYSPLSALFVCCIS